MTEEELQAIEQRANAVSTGPLKYRLKAGVYEDGLLLPVIDPAVLANADEDAISEFIALARHDVPALIAEIRRMKRFEIPALVGEVRRMQRGYEHASATAGSALKALEDIERAGL